ncbi:MAG: hypothetical protein GF331_20410 [Chitinivibrionales bacterium]|nr:hypothetical protein [Chitinivibrionales bacterium]
MSSLDFEIEWIETGRVRAEELKATWASLKITVDGRPITRVFDKQLNSVREHLFVPTYPLAEWIAFNWWNLFYECFSDARARNYPQRHNLRFGREGFALPNLQISPKDDLVFVQWSEQQDDTANLEYLTRGSAHIERVALEAAFRRIVEATLQRLHDCGVDESPLEEEWRAIEDADPAETEFCVAAAALGLNPYEVTEPLSEEIIKAANLLPSEIRYEFLSVANADELRKQADNLSKTIERLTQAEAVHSYLADIKKETGTYTASVIPADADAPWKEGYRCARKLRDELSIDGKAFESMADLLGVLQMHAASEDLRGEQPENAEPYDSLVVINKVNSAQFSVPKKREESRKFAFARALYEYLFTDLKAASLTTATTTSQQKRNRAFAAEFLAPSAVLQRLVRTRAVSSDDVDELAGQLGVSYYVIANQLLNHGIVDTIAGHSEDIYIEGRE